jgi:hypothetical protein
VGSTSVAELPRPSSSLWCQTPAPEVCQQDKVPDTRAVDIDKRILAVYP